MSRPPKQPDRSTVSGDEVEAFDAVIDRERRMSGGASAAPDEAFQATPFVGALLTSPPLAALCAQMGTFVRTAGNRSDSYSHADREFVDQVLSADWQTTVVQRMHIVDAVGAGVRLEAIEALRYHHEEDLTDDERLLATYVRQVVSGGVDDETYGRMEARLGARGLVEYTGFILWLGWIIRMMQALGIRGPSEEELDRIVEQLRSGGDLGQDYEARLV